VRRWIRSGVVAVATCVLGGSSFAATAPKPTTLSASAGTVYQVSIRSFLPIADKSSFVRVQGVKGGEIGGAALVGESATGVHAEVVNQSCRFAGKCNSLGAKTVYGTARMGDKAGVPAGSYRLVVVGLPSSRVTLRIDGQVRLVKKLASQSRVTVTGLANIYPASGDQMPEGYFDLQLPDSDGPNLTLLMATLDAGRPKTLQFSSCLRIGPVPAVHLPRYGSSCPGDAEGMTTQSGAVSVGGEDCETVPVAICLPLTADSVQLAGLIAGFYKEAPRASVTGDISALKSNIRATAVVFDLPGEL
jgi:hypothetical protein